MNQLIIQLWKEIQLNNPDQKIDFYVGENDNRHQMCNAYLQYEKIVGKMDADPADCTFINENGKEFYCLYF